ncbi:MAG: hypothetical protein ACJ742_22105 [Actinomycetes bacterium]|jgi:hypothetical protein
MHVHMLQQLAADRVAELRADARRVRYQRVRRDQRASEASKARIEREWRILVHALRER